MMQGEAERYHIMSAMNVSVLNPAYWIPSIFFSSLVLFLTELVLAYGLDRQRRPSSQPWRT